MVRVYNPIYDTVFKYLMEDDKAAKVLLGSILDKKIIELDLKNNDYSIVTEGDMKIVRLDFCAKIVDKKTKQTEVVTIELQKAFDEEEVVRFRKYLGLQYQRVANNTVITKKRRNKDEEYTILKPMHIYAIYILGHSLGVGLEYSVLKGKYIFENLDGEVVEIPKHHEFPNGLTHDLIIVQIPHLTDKPKRHVEKLLSIFDQRQIIDQKDPKYINIDEDRDSSDDYRTLVTRLLKGTADEDMRGKIDLEEEMERKFKRIRYERAELTDALNEAKNMITKQNTNLVEKDKALAEKENLLAEKNNQLASMMTASIKALSSVGISPDQIAAQLNLPIAEVNKVLDK